MKIGIVGLPNVGKSTLFTSLTKKQVPRENYPFCTIDPNIGVAAVPDKRLDVLTVLSESAVTTTTAIEFVDIAGLVRGAHQGEGLGNQFLSHIKEVDAICQVVRAFSDENIHHVEGAIDPARDIETINLELALADLNLIIRRIHDVTGQTRSGDPEAAAKLAVYQKIKATLDKGQSARRALLTDQEMILVRELNLLTLKPLIYVFNVNHTPTAEESAKLLAQFHQLIAPDLGLVLNIQQEAELADLSPEEAADYLTELQIEKTGLDQFIQTSYQLLDLITFLTTGPDETRAWTVAAGTLAPGAAGKIHSDIERGFIRAEIVSYTDLISAGGWQAAKDQGVSRLEGKEYVMREGDVCYFRFAV